MHEAQQERARHDSSDTNKDGAPVTAKKFDDVLESVPMGYFQYRLLLICGLSYMSDGMEVMLLSFISTCAGAEWGLSEPKMALIISVVFAGALVGSLFWGTLADKYGRRKAFMLGCAIVTISGFLSGVSPGYMWLLFFRCLVGVGVGGITISADILAEFLPRNERGQFLIYISYFWSFGAMFVAAIAWTLLPSSGWRVVAIVTAIPVALASALSVALLPESPRWLLTQRREQEAAAIIHQAAAINGVELEPFTLMPVVEEKEDFSMSGFFEPNMVKLSLTVWTVWFCVGFCYYSVVIFITRIFEHNSDDDDDDGEGSCSFYYAPIFLSAVAEAAGVGLTSLVINRWGRVKSQTTMFALAGCSMFLLGWQMPFAGLIVVAIAARLAEQCAITAKWVATPEFFPTHLRARGHSIAYCISRIGAFCSPFVADTSQLSVQEVGLILAGLNFVAVFCTLFLPETRGVDLDTELRVNCYSTLKSLCRCFSSKSNDDDRLNRPLIHQQT